ncbi:ABC-type xenobiotic transporter [Ranunculus cassubicifolius]
MDEEKSIESDANQHKGAASIRRPAVKGKKKTSTKDNKEKKDDLEKNKGEETSANTVPYYKLFSFADSKDVLLMIIGTIASIANGMAMPIVTLLVGHMINAFGQNATNRNTLREVSKVALQFVYLAIGAGIASFFQVACWMITGERQAARMRNSYLKTILKQDVAFFDTEINTGDVIGRMSGDTVLIQDATGEKVGKFLQLFTTFIGGFLLAFTKGWFLTLLMMTSIPPIAISGALMTNAISKMAARGQAAYSQAGVVVEQTISSIKTVASFTREKHAVTEYEKSLNKAYKSSVQEGLASGIGQGTVLLILFCSYALALWFGGLMISEKGYTGGDVINIILAVLTGSKSLGQASPCLTAFAAGQAAAFKMFETINRKPEIDSFDSNGRKLDDIRGYIELRNVSFSYPARPDEQIFSGLNLFMPSGTTSALVGQSGSGKSTVISLIERFYDPQAGTVLIDGINIKEFQLRWIRSKIGLVSQEPVLFASSIKDNISYGKDGATVEEITAATELANAAKFIDKLPQGLDTLVGEHGAQLSGGQKQRICIARAILKDPRILLLDEATSALDAESEHIVQEALDRIMVNRTTVIVAHRLSTVRNADMIAVIHQGKLAEKGSHLELLKNPNGAYSLLVRLQALNRSDRDSANNAEFNTISSQRQSFGRSIYHASPGTGNNPRRSFSDPFRISIEAISDSFRLSTETIQEIMSNVPESTLPEPMELSQEVPLRRLAYLNKPELLYLLTGLLAAVVNGVLFPVFAVLFSSIIKTFFEPIPELKKDSRHWAAMIVLLGMVSLIATPTRTFFFSVAGCRLIRRIRSLCFEKVVYMEINWFNEPEHSSGTIGARLSADAAAVRCLVGDALSLLVENTTCAIAGLVIAFTADWALALIVLGVAPVIVINGIIQTKFMTGFSADAKTMYEEASQVASDAVGSIRTIASFCAEEKVMQLYEMKCKGPLRTGIRQGLVSGIGYGVSFCLLFCVNATCFYAGGRLVEDGKTTFASVFKVLFALTMTAVGMSQSSTLAPDSSKAKTSTASIFGILDRKSKIDSSDDTGLTSENVNGEIVFRHVSFNYPTRPDIQIFTDLCLAIHSGKTIALVGESGSGKSTVISLLQRFYNPDSGQITLDGVEIQKFQLRWLRQQMALVSQEPVLFNTTIRANIAYGKEGDATETEILAAAELANAHKFICGLKQGYDTVVGERGIQLSGGQKQRVAIARAMVKSPKILLLDEATSALDAESERVVQDALDGVMENRTSVVVAHRLSTIKNADLIAVVKNGVIAEKGKHDSLMNIKDGIYASLVALHRSTSSE